MFQSKTVPLNYEIACGGDTQKLPRKNDPVAGKSTEIYLPVESDSSGKTIKDLKSAIDKEKDNIKSPQSQVMFRPYPDKYGDGAKGIINFAGDKKDPITDVVKSMIDNNILEKGGLVSISNRPVSGKEDPAYSKLQEAAKKTGATFVVDNAGTKANPGGGVLVFSPDGKVETNPQGEIYKGNGSRCDSTVHGYYPNGYPRNS